MKSYEGSIAESLFWNRKLIALPRRQLTIGDPVKVALPEVLLRHRTTAVKAAEEAINKATTTTREEMADHTEVAEAQAQSLEIATNVAR